MKTMRRKVTNRNEILKKIGIILEPWIDDIDHPEGLDEHTSPITDIGLDSVAIMQLILGIEKEFNITIRDNELDSEVFSKMANLIDIIEGKLGETN